MHHDSPRSKRREEKMLIFHSGLPTRQRHTDNTHTQPTVSTMNGRPSALQDNRGSTRVFSLGIGEADRELVNGIARSGGGTVQSSLWTARSCSLLAKSPRAKWTLPPKPASCPASILYGAIR